MSYNDSIEAYEDQEEQIKDLLDVLHLWAAWHYQKFGDTIDAGAPISETQNAINKSA